MNLIEQMTSGSESFDESPTRLTQRRSERARRIEHAAEGTAMFEKTRISEMGRSPRLTGDYAGNDGEVPTRPGVGRGHGNTELETDKHAARKWRHGYIARSKGAAAGQLRNEPMP